MTALVRSRRSPDRPVDRNTDWTTCHVALSTTNDKPTAPMNRIQPTDGYADYAQRMAGQAIVRPQAESAGQYAPRHDRRDRLDHNDRRHRRP